MAFSYSKSKGSDGRYLTFSEPTTAPPLMGFVSRHHDARHHWSRVLFAAGAILLIIILAKWFEVGIPFSGKAPLLQEVDHSFQSGKVQIEVYYEVLCPDSRYFIRKQLYPAWDKVGEIMDIHFKPYGKASQQRKPHEITFQCQHGPTECKGNMVHACGIKYVKRQEQLVEFIYCMMDNNYDAFEVGQQCANKLGIDWAQLQTCASGREGQELLAMYGDDTHSLRPKVSFIPTIVLNGSQDGQRAILKNLLLELCRAYKGSKPANCLSIL